jgi:diguanylate cyclase (GGDEF)-like protein
MRKHQAPGRRSTEKKVSNTVASLNRVNRVLTMLSQINRAIVRAESPDGLYLDACRIAVECGLFKYAWIGLADSVNAQIRVMSTWGDSGSAERTVPGELAELVRGNGEPFVCKDIGALKPLRLGREDMLTRGFQSVAVLPLREGGHVIGVFSLYADHALYFDQTIVALLSEVADDISFSLEHILNEQRRLAAEAKLHYLAFYDSQTGLPNRTLLEQRLPQLAAKVDHRKSQLSLFVIKLRRIEKVVQLLGSLAMDDALRTLGLRLENHRADEDLAAQLGMDEFAIVALGLTDDGMIDTFAQTLQEVLAEPVKAGDKEILLQASIGVAIYPRHEGDIRYLLRRARVAAEHSGTEGGIRLYSPDLDRDLEQRVQTEVELHRALERSEFELYYQPQLNLKSGAMVGVEALLRWRHPQRGLIPPAYFIRLLEETGLMPEVGEWVLRAACKQASAWQKQGLEPLRMAVNLSAQQFRVANLVQTVKAALTDAGLEPEFLELELTESLILENAEQTIHTMHELRRLGVTLSLDDFGTGYSSLSYLRRYPINRIKIDQSFVRDMTEHPSSAALVRSILAMAANLGLQTIAEGVETTGQFGYLRKQLCQDMQGFLFSRPIPGPELTQLLRDGARLQPDATVAESRYTLLAVDDEPGILSALKRVFRRESWQVLTANNAAEGFEQLAGHEVGVILCDQRMPGVSGTEFLQRVKVMYPDTIRILLTGYSDFTSVIDAVNRGDLYKVISKPFDDDALREDVREAFRRYEVFAENRRLAQRLETFEQQHPQED